MDLFPAPPTPPTGDTPVDAVMRTAREKAVEFFEKDLTPGSAGEILDQATRIREEWDQLNHAMATALARIEASNQLLNEGGQRELSRWARHAFGISGNEASDFAAVGRASAGRSMPETIEALTDGMLSFGESAAIIKSTERETAKRDTQSNEDAGLFRAKMECGLLAFKKAHPVASVAALAQAGAHLGARLNPERPEREHTEAHTERGARISRTFNGSFHLEAWGSAADALRLETLLQGYANPYNAEEGLTSAQRTYDALLNAMGYAHSHQGCDKPGKPVALIHILIPAQTLIGTDPADGAEGVAPATTPAGRVVPTSAVRELFSEAVLRNLMIEQHTGEVLDVGHEYRTATPAIKAAAYAGHTTCAWQHGCDVPLEWTQADHIVEWWQGGRTSAENIQPLCSTHNRLKHQWGLRRDRTMWSGRTRNRPPGPPGPTRPQARKRPPVNDPRRQTPDPPTPTPSRSPALGKEDRHAPTHHALCRCRRLSVASLDRPRHVGRSAPGWGTRGRRCRSSDGANDRPRHETRCAQAWGHSLLRRRLSVAGLDRPRHEGRCAPRWGNPGPSLLGFVFGQAEAGGNRRSPYSRRSRRVGGARPGVWGPVDNCLRCPTVGGMTGRDTGRVGIGPRSRSAVDILRAAASLATAHSEEGTPVFDTPDVPRVFPVSVKGVVIRDDRVLLLRNERDEWELPGGKIEIGETPEECLAREIEEETGWPVEVATILDSWMYHVTQVDRHVFIVTYGCRVSSRAPVVVSSEHKEAGLFSEAEVPGLPMPEGYKRSVLDWFTRSRA